MKDKADKIAPEMRVSYGRYKTPSMHRLAKQVMIHEGDPIPNVPL